MTTRFPYEHRLEYEDRTPLTMGDLKALDLPDDYVITFDGFYGRCSSPDLIVNDETKEICVNG